MSVDPAAKLDDPRREPQTDSTLSRTPEPPDQPDRPEYPDEAQVDDDVADAVDEPWPDYGLDDVASNWEPVVREPRQDIEEMRARRDDSADLYFNAASLPRHADLYPIWCEQWARAVQVRWSTLFQLLLANTLMVLGWSALFAGVFRGGASQTALLAVSITGFLLSAIWLFVSDRSNGFVAMYAQHARDAEGDRLGPFKARDAHRALLQGLSGAMRTSRIVIGVPLVFLLLFFVLIVLSALSGQVAV